MARPKVKKNKYEITLTPVGNLQLAKYDEEENREILTSETDYTNIIKYLVRTHKDKALLFDA